MNEYEHDGPRSATAPCWAGQIGGGRPAAPAAAVKPVLDLVRALGDGALDLAAAQVPPQ